MKRFRRGSDHSTLTLKIWDFTGTALLNFFMFLFIVAYLSPLPFMVIASFTPRNQFLDSKAPILPSERERFNYEGKDLIVYHVPTDDGERQLALYKPSRQSSEFIDPKDPSAGPIHWEGNWRSLEAVYHFKPTLENFEAFLGVTRIPLLFKNTILVALISEIGGRRYIDAVIVVVGRAIIGYIIVA